MQLKTILNSIEKQKGFVYGNVKWSNESKNEIEVEIQPRSNSSATCSVCGKKRPGYDRLKPRRFEYVPLWAIAVYFVYSMRRVDCPKCGVMVEKVPWASGKNQQTRSYRLFLATWAKRLSWQEVARVFGTSWDSVYRAIDWVVCWGLVHRDLHSINTIGVDESRRRAKQTAISYGSGDVRRGAPLPRPLRYFASASNWLSDNCLRSAKGSRCDARGDRWLRRLSWDP